MLKSAPTSLQVVMLVPCLQFLITVITPSFSDKVQNRRAAACFTECDWEQCPTWAENIWLHCSSVFEGHSNQRTTHKLTTLTIDHGLVFQLYTYYSMAVDCPSVGPGRGIPHWRHSLRFFSCQKVVICSSSSLYQELRAEGVAPWWILRPCEEECDDSPQGATGKARG